MSEDKKRERCKNYTEKEKLSLLEIVPDYMEVIENKKTDNVSVKEKTNTWSKIANIFNANAESGIRTGVQIKLLYEAIKRKAKKDKADEKVELYKTEGGKFNKKIDGISQKFLEIHNQEIFHLTNQYDSTSSFDEQINSTSNGNHCTQNETEIMDRMMSTYAVVSDEVPSTFVDVTTPVIVVDKSPHNVVLPLTKRQIKIDYKEDSEEIKFKILKVQLEKEEIERDILKLKRQEMELVIKEKKMLLEEKQKMHEQ